METGWHVGYDIVAALLCVAAAGVAAVCASKLRRIRARREEEAWRSRLEGWMAGVIGDLEGEERLRPPEGWKKQEAPRFLQETMIGWIEQHRGERRRKVVALCEEMGLVDRQLRRLESPFEWVKLDAAYYLGCMRSPRAVPGLTKLLESMRFGPMVFIVGRAVAKCARHADELRDAVHLLLAHRKEAHALIADMLAESELDLSAMLETFLRGGDADCVRLALAAMRKRPLAGCGDELYRLTAAEQADIRASAAALLLKDDAGVTEERTRRLLVHPDGEVRALAAKAAGRLGLAPCLSALRAAMADPEWEVRLNAARAMAALGEEGFAALREAAKPEAEPGAAEAREVIREVMRKRESASRGAGWTATILAE